MRVLAVLLAALAACAHAVVPSKTVLSIVNALNSPSGEIGSSVTFSLFSMTIPADNYSIRVRGLGLTPMAGNTCEAKTLVNNVRQTASNYSFVLTNAESLDSITFPGPVPIPEGLYQDGALLRIDFVCATNVATAGTANYVASGFRTQGMLHLEFTRLSDSAIFFVQGPLGLRVQSSATQPSPRFSAGVEYFFPDDAGLDFLDGIDASLSMGLSVSLARSRQYADGGWTTLTSESEFALNVPLFPGIEATVALACSMALSPALRAAAPDAGVGEPFPVAATDFPGALVLSFSASAAPAVRTALLTAFDRGDAYNVTKLVTIACTGLVRQRNAFPRHMEVTLDAPIPGPVSLDFISRTPSAQPLVRALAQHAIHSAGTHVGAVFQRRPLSTPLDGLELAALSALYAGIVPLPARSGQPVAVEAVQTEAYVVVRLVFPAEDLADLMLGPDAAWEPLPASFAASFPSLTYLERRHMDPYYGLVLCEIWSLEIDYRVGPCQFTDPPSKCGSAQFNFPPLCAKVSAYSTGAFNAVVPYLPADAPECTLRSVPVLRPPFFTAGCASWRAETTPGSGVLTTVPPCPTGCYADSTPETFPSPPKCVFSDGIAVAVGLEDTYCPESVMRDPRKPCANSDRCARVCATSGSVAALDAAVAAGTTPLPALSAARCGSAASPYTSAPATWPPCDACGSRALSRPLFCADSQTVSGTAGTQFLSADAPAAAVVGGSPPRAVPFHMCNGAPGSLPTPATTCDSTSLCTSEWECALESDAAEPPAADRVWLPCTDPAVALAAAPCEPGCAAAQKRSLRCAVYATDGSKTVGAAVRSDEPRAVLLSQLCATSHAGGAVLPARSQPCPGASGCSLSWRCRPLGAPASASISCDVNPVLPLGPDNGGFDPCPTAGCAAATTSVSRSVACFLGASLLEAAACAELPRPDTGRQCGPATDGCVSVFPAMAPCVEDIGSRSPLLCTLVDADGSVITPIRVATCLDPATGAARPDAWCWPLSSSPPPTEPCTALPACALDTPLEYPPARWIVPVPSPCLSGRDFACKSVAPVALACETSADGGSTWEEADLAVCGTFAPGPAPPAAVPCPSNNQLAAACGLRGVCALSDFVSPVDDKTYSLARGACVCALGYFGDACELSFTPANVTVEAQQLPDGEIVLRGSFRFSDEAPGSTALAARVPAVVVTLEPADAEAPVPSRLLATLAPAGAHSDVTDAIEFHATLTPQAVLPPAGAYRVRVRVPPTATTADVSARSAVVAVPSMCDGRCTHGGTCVRETGRCACLGGWTGDLCDVSPCATAGCNELPGMSTCEVDAETQAAVCRCATHPVTRQPFYTGPTCTAPGIGCAGSRPCENGGMRIVAASPLYAGFACGLCHCSGAWTGATCAECTQPCFSPGGAADGQCAACVCNAGYTGPTCGCRFATVRLDFKLLPKATPWLRAASAAGESLWLSSLEAELGVAANGQLADPQRVPLVTPRIVGAAVTVVDGASLYSVTAALYSATACVSAEEHTRVISATMSSVSPSAVDASDALVDDTAVPAEPRMDDTHTAIANLVVAFRSGSLRLTDSLAGLDTAAGMSVADGGCDAAEEGSCPAGVSAPTDPGVTPDPGDGGGSNPSAPPAPAASSAGLSTTHIVVIVVLVTLFVAATVSVVIGCWVHSSTAAAAASPGDALLG